MISKLKANAHLILPYSGKAKQGKGRPALQVYADNMREQLLQVVIIQRTNPQTKHVAQTILFSNDLHLEPLLLLKYYSLRFQIEFDFRNANRSGEPPIFRACRLQKLQAKPTHQCCQYSLYLSNRFADFIGKVQKVPKPATPFYYRPKSHREGSNVLSLFFKFFPKWL